MVKLYMMLLILGAIKAAPPITVTGFNMFEVQLYQSVYFTVAPYEYYFDNCKSS